MKTKRAQHLGAFLLGVLFLAAALFGVSLLRAPAALFAEGEESGDTPEVDRLKPYENFLNAEIYRGEIAGEVAPDPQEAFAGSWYNKIYSGQDWWLGTEAVITLPEVYMDVNRTDDLNRRYLDNPSVYMGSTTYKGASVYESDVGFTWSPICENPDRDDPSVSGVGMAFRPFVRHITLTGANDYYNPDKFDYQYYYFPGDTVRMSLLATKENCLTLIIQLLSPTTIPKYKAIRARYSLPENTDYTYISEDFESYGQTTTQVRFKQVNAIDQVANEGKPTQPSKTMVTGCVWQQSYLYREIEGKLCRVPFNRTRYDELASPLADGKDSLGFLRYEDEAMNMMYGYRAVDVNAGNATNYRLP